MNPTLRTLLLTLPLAALGTAAGTLLLRPAPAAADSHSSFKECGFVSATWLPEHAPAGLPGKYKGLTPVPAGWTVVGGNMGSAPAMFVCR